MGVLIRLTAGVARFSHHGVLQAGVHVSVCFLVGVQELDPG